MNEKIVTDVDLVDDITWNTLRAAIESSDQTIGFVLAIVEELLSHLELDEMKKVRQLVSEIIEEMEEA